jgi:membrane protein
MNATLSSPRAPVSGRPSLLKIIGDSLVGWVKDGAPSMGAAIAFYSLFAAAPILLMVIQAAGLVVGPDVVQEHVLGQFHRLLGNAGFAAARAVIGGLNADAHGHFSTVAGLVTLLFGASSVFAELQNALNRIWRAEPRSAAQGLRHAVRARLLAFALVFAAGFLLMVLLVATSGLAMLAGWLGTVTSDSHQVVWLLDAALGFAVATLLFAVIFRYIPQQRVAWHAVWVGALVTAALFSAGRLVMVVYLGRTALNSLYGFAGSFLLLLLWVYYSAQIFLLGAEFTYRYAAARDCAPAPVSNGT